MKSASELDAELGMEVYASSSPPCTAKVKTSEDDFRVEEVVALDSLTNEAKPGYYPVYRVEKRSIDTLHMEAQLSSALGSRLSYGGLKDKKAVTVQYVTPTSARTETPLKVARTGFSAGLLGYLPAPVTKGSVIGNRFALILRDCCERASRTIGDVFEDAKLKRLPNYFGYQRFGSSGAGTHNIGRAIVKRKFDEAVRLMLLQPRKWDDEATHAGREAMARGDFKAGLKLLHPGQDLERAVAGRLAADPNDMVRALRAVPVKVRRLFVQAYQSYIFNRTISLAVAGGLDISAAESGDNWTEILDGVPGVRVGSSKETPPARALPMIQLAGYAFRDYGSRFDALASKVMRDEGTAPRDFYVKEMQEVSGEGGFRIAHLLLAEPAFETKDGSAVLGFMLARGQYATVLLREIIKPLDPLESGIA